MALFWIKKSKSFTLIELLVVISIIALLAAIVLVFLSGARNRTKDARIIADMGQIRSSAEIFLRNTGSYTNLCSSTDVTTLQSDITTQSGTNFNCQIQTAAPAGSSYCVEVQLNSTKWWCVDSALRSKQYDSAPVCDVGQGTKVCE
jgi:prepilin-type N-terminal cleavage/methylation domain-containing protein